MSDRGILDQIDDVIAWDGRSADAMRWSADEPKQLDLSGFAELAPRVDSEVAQRLLENASAAMAAIAEALRPVGEALSRTLHMFGEIANSPEMRDLVEAHRLVRSTMKSKYNRRRRGRRR